MFRSWVSLLDAGSLGETADGPGSRIITLRCCFLCWYVAAHVRTKAAYGPPRGALGR